MPSHEWFHTILKLAWCILTTNTHAPPPWPRPQPQTPMLLPPHLKPNVINTHTHSDPNRIQQRRHQNAREGFIPSNDESNVEEFKLWRRQGHDGLQKTTVIAGSIRRGLKLGKAWDCFRDLIRTTCNHQPYKDGFQD